MTLETRAQSVFKRFVDEEIAPFLRERGFARSGSTFHVRRDDAWGVVNFQRSASSTAAQVRFTVNVGATSEHLRDHPPWKWGGGRRPAESSCVVRERIGSLSGQSDVWWTIDHEAHLARLGEDVRAVLADYALRWLEPLLSNDALATFVREHGTVEADEAEIVAALSRGRASVVPRC